MSEEEKKNETWGQRNAVGIMTTVLFGLLGFVMLIQVAC